MTRLNPKTTVRTRFGAFLSTFKNAKNNNILQNRANFARYFQKQKSL